MRLNTFSIKRLKIYRIFFILLTIAIHSQHRADAQVLRQSLQIPGNGLGSYRLTPDGEGGLLGLFVSITAVPDGNEGPGIFFDQPIFFHINAEGEFLILKEWELKSNGIAHTFLQAADGNFYGILKEGGAFDAGVLWRITTNGEYSELHDHNPEEEGGFSYTNLIEGNDGRFYTATGAYGPAGAGAILAFDPNGGVEVIHVFIEEDHDRGFRFIKGGNGRFFGTIASSLAPGEDSLDFWTAGSIFQISESGLFEKVHFFEKGIEAYDLTVGKDGVLYGSILDRNDGHHLTGLFRYSDSRGFEIIKYFDSEDLQSNALSLWPVSSGEILGSYSRNAWDGNGAMFKISSQGEYQDLDDHLYIRNLIESKDGSLFGVEVVDITTGLQSDWTEAFVRIHDDGSRDRILKAFNDDRYFWRFSYSFLTEISDRKFALVSRREGFVFIDIIEVIEGPISTSSDLGKGWRLLDWFGNLFINQYPWVFHSEHGWLYFQYDQDNIWLFDPILGWLWTSLDKYPVIFRMDGGTWLFYKRNTTAPRRFYDFSRQEWFDVF